MRRCGGDASIACLDLAWFQTRGHVQDSCTRGRRGRTAGRAQIFRPQGYVHTHTHTRARARARARKHTRTCLTALFQVYPGEPVPEAKPIWILLKQETVRGSGISWAVCKSAPRPRQITTPAPHHSVFFTGRMPFLPPNQQRQSTEGQDYVI